MKRSLLLPALVAGLLLVPAASAGARVVELGADLEAVTPSCPADPCQVLARATGYPGRAGSVAKPFTVPRTGTILAFSVPLGAPTADQIAFFTDEAGFGEPEVRLSILRQGKERKRRLDHRLLAQSPSYDVLPYFGSTPTFVLPEPIRVKKGLIVALTSSTWVPAFATGIARSNWWRASREREQCESPESLEPFALTERLELREFGCTYHGARPLYTVTFVPDNKPTSEQPKEE